MSCPLWVNLLRFSDLAEISVHPPQAAQELTVLADVPIAERAWLHHARMTDGEDACAVTEGRRSPRFARRSHRRVRTGVTIAQHHLGHAEAINNRYCYGDPPKHILTKTRRDTWWFMRNPRAIGRITRYLSSRASTLRGGISFLTGDMPRSWRSFRTRALQT